MGICGLSEEEKKTIDDLTMRAITSSVEAPDYPNCIVMKKDLITLLNLIQKQESEINKLNNVIDRMAEIIEDCRANGCLETTDDLDMSEIAGANKIKEYFMKEDK